MNVFSFFFFISLMFFLPTNIYAGEHDKGFYTISSLGENCPILTSYPPLTKIAIRDKSICLKNNDEKRGSFTINIQNIVKRDNAMLNILIFNTEKTWLQLEKAAIRIAFPFHQNRDTVVVKNLPIGFYAVGVFQDVNNNSTLDMRWFPIPAPKEGVGVSGKTGGFFGPPGFVESAINTKGKTSIIIRLEYYN